MDVFEHDNELKHLYSKETKNIQLEKVEELEAPLYVFLNAKELCQQLDLKKEVILTMLNSLEKIDPSKSFFKLESMLPAYIGMRFHKSKPEELSKTNKFIRQFMEIAVEK